MSEETSVQEPAPVEETPAAPAPAAEAPKESLSNRAALEKAISEKREVRSDAGVAENRAPSEPNQPTKQEVKEAVAAGVEAPAEFNALERKAWEAGDVAGIQKAFRRVHDSRTQEITRAQRAEREALEGSKPWKDIASKAAPYIAARGKEGVTPEQAIMEALALIDSFKSENPQNVKAELKKIGIDLDAKPQEQKQIDPEVLSRLQAVENTLQEKERQQQFAALSQTFGQSIANLAALKTRTGEAAFPGFQDSSEAGIQFARELGSLTQEPLFQKLVLRRIPNATHVDLVREAYIQLGGKVAGDPVKVSPEAQQKHLEKSRRAAASTPGRVVARNDSSNLVGKLGRRAALQRALEEHREH
jgi:hypothetical protein